MILKKEHKCFCGSNKNINQCHKGVRSNSKYAKVYKLYSKIEKDILDKIKELNLKPKCGKGCSECCHQIFSISEVEFCIIIDYLLEHYTKKQIDEIFEKSYEIINYLKINDPIFFKRLQSDVTGGNLTELIYSNLPWKENVIPQGCVFLNDKNECIIYKIRPLICRTHGVAYFSKDYNNQLCSKLKISDENRNEFVDLTSYNDEASSSYFFKYKDNIITRRPYPIFYWFCFLKDNGLNLNKFKKTVLYSRYVVLSESEMIEELFKVVENIF